MRNILRTHCLLSTRNKWNALMQIVAVKFLSKQNWRKKRKEEMKWCQYFFFVVPLFIWQLVKMIIRFLLLKNKKNSSSSSICLCTVYTFGLTTAIAKSQKYKLDAHNIWADQVFFNFIWRAHSHTHIHPSKCVCYILFLFCGLCLCMSILWKWEQRFKNNAATAATHTRFLWYESLYLKWVIK